MELLFYIGMIFWGIYLLVNEDIEDVKKILELNNG